MKKKKLRLNRETIRRLNERSLDAAFGRGNTYELETGCACTDGCDPGSNGCGSAPCGGSEQSCTCIVPESYCYCP